jgi:uncharacterized repeat protein (TIGR03809 family)
MTEWQAARRIAGTAQKWRDLVNQRRAHFLELHKTGRWKRYYAEGQFLLLMREALALAKAWSVIAPRPQDDNEAAPGPADPAANPQRRTAL